MEDLCERKLINKELLSQYLDTLTYKDTRNISRNMHKARSSKLLPLPTDIEETHEALTAVQVWTSSTELSVNDPETTIVMFSWKNNLQFLAPLMGFTLTRHSNQHRSFSTNYLQFTMCNLHFYYRQINIQRPMQIYQTYGIRGCNTCCECFSNNCFCWFRNSHSQHNDNSVARLGS